MWFALPGDHPSLLTPSTGLAHESRQPLWSLPVSLEFVLKKPQKSEHSGSTSPPSRGPQAMLGGGAPIAPVTHGPSRAASGLRWVPNATIKRCCCCLLFTQTPKSEPVAPAPGSPSPLLLACSVTCGCTRACPLSDPAFPVPICLLLQCPPGPKWARVSTPTPSCPSASASQPPEAFGARARSCACFLPAFSTAASSLSR